MIFNILVLIALGHSVVCMFDHDSFSEAGPQVYIQVTSILEDNSTKNVMSTEPVLRLTVKANMTCTVACGIVYSSVVNVSLNFTREKLKVAVESFKVSNYSYRVICYTTIKIIPEYDRELFTCKLRGSSFRAQRLMYLNILYPPKIHSVPGTLNVNQDESLELLCNASGNPGPMVRWFKWSDSAIDWIPLPSGSTHQIRAVNKWHHGRYKCVAENNLGSSVKYTIVRVKGGIPHAVMLWIFLIVLILMIAVAVINCLPKFRKTNRRRQTRQYSSSFDYGGLMNRRMSFFYAVQRDSLFSRQSWYQDSRSLPLWQQQGLKLDRKRKDKERNGQFETNI